MIIVLNGKIIVNKRAKIIAKIGATRNLEEIVEPILVKLLKNNFTASAKGWSKPKAPTFIGPTRV